MHGFLTIYSAKPKSAKSAALKTPVAISCEILTALPAECEGVEPGLPALLVELAVLPEPVALGEPVDEGAAEDVVAGTAVLAFWDPQTMVCLHSSCSLEEPAVSDRQSPSATWHTKLRIVWS